MASEDRIRVWAEALIRLHLPGGSWTFGFDHAKTRFGACDHQKKRITISRYLSQVAEDDDVHQVLLHEVAHAIAGARAGHGPAWRRIAEQIGYEGGRTHNHDVSAEHAKWLGRCPNGHEVVRFRRPKRPTSCASCHPQFHRDYLIEWVDRRARA